MKDLWGQPFGRLTAICLHHKEIKHDGKGVEYFWLTLCSCGEWKVVRRSHLISKATQSCGCMLLESRKWIGANIGILNLVLGRLPGLKKNRPCWPDDDPRLTKKAQGYPYQGIGRKIILLKE